VGGRTLSCLGICGECHVALDSGHILRWIFSKARMTSAKINSSMLFIPSYVRSKPNTSLVRWRGSASGKDFVELFAKATRPQLSDVKAAGIRVVEELEIFLDSLRQKTVSRLRIATGDSRESMIRFLIYGRIIS
jgi:hypothetical protein